MTENIHRILVVDDIERNRKTIGAALWKEPVELIEASSGVEALELVESLDPDLVLLDVMMPGMDGFETTRRIRNSETRSEVPIVLVTALDDEASLVQGFDSGADDFIAKPFNQIELRARVRSILRLNRYRRFEEERQARDRIAQRAKENELLYQEVVERAEVMIQVLSAEGQVLFANSVWLETFGYTQDEVNSLNLGDLVHPSSMEHCQQILASVMGQASPQQVEADLVARDGRIVKIEGAVVSRGGSNGHTTLAMFRDMTVQARMSEELARAQQLEQVGRLTAGLAHDFGNILAVISMCLPEPSPTSEDREWVDDMRTAVSDGMDLIRDLMGVSRSAVIDLQAEDASTQIKLAVDTVTRLLPSSVSTHLNLEPRAASILVHPPTLRRILLNLATNSRDAMDGRGDVFFETDFVDGEEGNVPMLRLRVRDTGPGVPPELLASMFDPFMTTKREGEGTGMGLASVRGLVQQMDGKIWAENASSGGLQTTILFPRV